MNVCQCPCGCRNRLALIDGVCTQCRFGVHTGTGEVAVTGVAESTGDLAATETPEPEMSDEGAVALIDALKTMTSAVKSAKRRRRPPL